MRAVRARREKKALIEEDDGSFSKEHPYPGNDFDVVEKLSMTRR